MKQMVITNDRTRTRFNIQKNMFLSCFNGVRKCLQYFTLQESSVTNLLNSRVHFIWCLHLSDQSARLAPEAGDLGICGGGCVEGAGGGGGGGGGREEIGGGSGGWRLEAEVEAGRRSQPRPVQRVQAGGVGEAGHRGQGGGEAAQGGGGQQRGRQRGGGSLVGRVSAGLQHVVMLSLCM